MSQCLLKNVILLKGKFEHNVSLLALKTGGSFTASVPGRTADCLKKGTLGVFCLQVSHLLCAVFLGRQIQPTKFPGWCDSLAEISRPGKMHVGDSLYTKLDVYPPGK